MIYGELRAIWLNDYELEEYIDAQLNLEFEEEESR